MWSDDCIRNACQIGTAREMAAYLAAGYVLAPTPAISPPLISSLDGNDWEIPVTMQALAELVSKKHRITVAQLLGSSKHQEFVKARAEFCGIANRRLGKSTTQIGKFLRRDHTTIVHYLQWENEDYRKKYRAKRRAYYFQVEKVKREAQRGNGGNSGGAKLATKRESALAFIQRTKYPLRKGAAVDGSGQGRALEPSKV